MCIDTPDVVRSKQINLTQTKVSLFIRNNLMRHGNDNNSSGPLIITNHFGITS